MLDGVAAQTFNPLFDRTIETPGVLEAFRCLAASLAGRPVVALDDECADPGACRKSGIIWPKIPMLNGSKRANGHHSGSFGDPTLATRETPACAAPVDRHRVAECPGISWAPGDWISEFLAAVADDIAVEVAHCSKRRLFGLAALAQPRHPEPGRGCGRPPSMRDDDAITPPPAPLPPVGRRSFDYSGLDGAMALADEAMRHARLLFASLPGGAMAAKASAGKQRSCRSSPQTIALKRHPHDDRP